MAERGPLVVVHSSDERYGADRMVLEVLRAVPAGRAVELWLPTDLAHPDRPLCTEAGGPGVTVRHEAVPVLRRSHRTAGGLLRLAGRALRLLGPLRRARPELVYCATSATLACAPLARLVGTRRVVGHVQEIWSGADRRVLLPLARCCHELVCISGAVRDALPAVLQARAVVVPNATPDPGRVDSLVGRTGPLEYVVASRWNAWKGHRTLLAAWDLLDSPGRLTVLGGRPPSGEAVDVPALVAGLRHPGSVRVVGEVDDVGAHLEAADVVLVPSDAPEPFGLVAIEAMARGRPVVASAGGGVADVVQDGVTGWLYPLRDARALADVLAGLDRDAVARAGAAARTSYEQRYTPGAFGAAWRAAVIEPVKDDNDDR